MPDDVSRIARYVAIASVAAASIFYVFGPSLLPHDDFNPPKKHNAVGLSNYANDCFINSVLQALAASKRLRLYLNHAAPSNPDGELVSSQVDADRTEHDPGSHLSPCNLTTALHLMLEKLNDPLLRGRTTSARPFVQALEIAYNSRLSRQQQDAQEFLQLVVEKLVEENSNITKPFTNQKPCVESSPLPLEGKLESQIECLTCRYRPPANSSTFLTLSLNVPQRGVTTLDECFDILLKQEVIEDYICESCKFEHLVAAKQRQLHLSPIGESTTKLAEELSELQSKREAILAGSEELKYPTHASAPKRRIVKHMRIAHYPEVLLLHLSRSVYSSASSKNLARVRFDENLRLGTFDRRDYRLTSIVSHKGGHSSGHYETFRRQTSREDEPALDSPEEENTGVSDVSEPEKTKRRYRQRTAWWGISDDHVRQCRQRDVLDMQRGCYLLIYEKVDNSSQAP